MMKLTVLWINWDWIAETEYWFVIRNSVELSKFDEQKNGGKLK